MTGGAVAGLVRVSRKTLTARRRAEIGRPQDGSACHDGAGKFERAHEAPDLRTGRVVIICANLGREPGSEMRRVGLDSRANTALTKGASFALVKELTACPSKGSCGREKSISSSRHLFLRGPAFERRLRKLFIVGTVIARDICSLLRVRFELLTRERSVNGTLLNHQHLPGFG